MASTASTKSDDPEGILVTKAQSTTSPKPNGDGGDDLADPSKSGNRRLSKSSNAEGILIEFH